MSYHYQLGLRCGRLITRACLRLPTYAVSLQCAPAVLVLATPTLWTRRLMFRQFKRLISLTWLEQRLTRLALYPQDVIEVGRLFYYQDLVRRDSMKRGSEAGVKVQSKYYFESPKMRPQNKKKIVFFKAQFFWTIWKMNSNLTSWQACGLLVF